MNADSKPTNPKDAISVDKMPFHLWPQTATVEGSIALLEGALKYGRSNWRAVGVRASVYYDAAMRHLASWFEGEDYAQDSGAHHLAHALACLAILVDARAAGKLTDDRMFPGGYHKLLAERTPDVARLRAKVRLDGRKYADRKVEHYSRLTRDGSTQSLAEAARAALTGLAICTNVRPNSRACNGCLHRDPHRPNARCGVPCHSFKHPAPPCAPCVQGEVAKP